MTIKRFGFGVFAALLLSACVVLARQQTPLEIATSLRSCVYSLQLKNDATNRNVLANCKSLADQLVAAPTIVVTSVIDDPGTLGWVTDQRKTWSVDDRDAWVTDPRKYWTADE